MTDIVIELLRAVVIGTVLFTLLRAGRAKAVCTISGWQTLRAGFILIFFGSLIDITDNFEVLNRFVVIGNTEVQALLEKIVGYTLGYLLVALGIWKWLPKLIEQEELTRKKHELEVQAERLKVLRSTMRTVNDLFNSFRHNLYLYRLEAEKKNTLKPESLELMDSMIIYTTDKLEALSDLESTPEKQMVDASVETMNTTHHKRPRQGF